MKQIKHFFILLCFPIASFAWNGVGHSTGGAIAYYYLLNKNPETINKVLTLLENHPWYAQGGALGWADKLAGLSEEEKKVQLFMLASTFPDDARKTIYDHPTWHYINYPFVPAGQNVVGKNSPVPNAETKLTELINAFNSTTDLKEKAIDLCWIFHLIEDIHQPLHSTGLFDTNHPNGDQGGNLTFAKYPNYAPFKLHGFWDGLIKTGGMTIPEKAQALLANTKYADNQLPELTQHTKIQEWTFSESYPLAKSKAYLDGKITGTKTQPTEIDISYTKNRTQIAERRIILAGKRLANSLNTILG
jgi:hypothetical protein